MMVTQQQKSQILLSGKRNSTRGHGYLCYTTNFSDNIVDSVCVEDIFLDTNTKNTLGSKESGTAIFLPLVGRLLIGDKVINTGNVLIATIDNSEVENNNEQIQANYLKISINKTILANGVFNFDLSNSKNQLIPLLSNSSVHVHLGYFDARHETIYKRKIDSKQIIGYVIQGAFEFQNMLLQHRDGAIVFNKTEVIEFEALSEDALILIIEV